jgi:hypothetical protein
MKKKFFFMASFATVIFFSCKKDNTPNTPDPLLNSKDPVALSKAISVWHGSRVAGNAPAPSGGSIAPSVSGPSGGLVQALNGKYAIINPALLSGSVAGYYLGIAGANEYFKVDYSKPRTGNRPFPGRKHHNVLGRPLDDTDSSIVVVLPSNLQVPDTFCITYCPYDSLGNIGQPVTTCIAVNQLGGDASSSWIEGNWRYMGDNINDTNNFDTLVYGIWTGNSSTYSCFTDNSGNSYFTRTCFSDSSNNTSCTPLNASDSIFNYASDLSIGSNGAMQYIDTSATKSADESISTCSSIHFNTSSDSYHVAGGWSLTGDRVTLVFQIDESGLPDYSAEEYIVEHPDNNTLILQLTDGSGDKVWLKKL